MRKTIKWIGSFIFGYIVLYLFVPIFNGDKINLDTMYPYSSKYYWLEILVCTCFGIIIAYIASKQKPRKYYSLHNQLLIIPLISIGFTILFCSLVPIALIEQLFIKIVLIMIVFALSYFLGYFLYSKAIIIYDDGTIIIYNFKRKIYKNSKIKAIYSGMINQKPMIYIKIENDYNIIPVSLKISKKIIDQIKNDQNIQ